MKVPRTTTVDGIMTEDYPVKAPVQHPFDCSLALGLRVDMYLDVVGNDAVDPRGELNCPQPKCNEDGHHVQSCHYSNVCGRHVGLQPCNVYSLRSVNGIGCLS